jgi:DNA processing protein
MITTPFENEYPGNLRASLTPPEAVYINGKIKKKDSRAVAIVGTRLASKYGMETAKRFSEELAKNDVTIVSGLARGIDTVAHEAALAVGGRTIAVLGSGLDFIYPPENKSLSKKIARSGALITEFPPSTAPLPQNFLRRNRIIAGLSLAIIVIEGRRRSGTLSTARHAAEIGREVFAVPGQIDSPLSEAPLYLIEQGARVAKSPKDILEYLESVI